MFDLLAKLPSLDQFCLDFDRDYGVDKKTGWSVTVNGSVLSQFRDTPEEALLEAAESILSAWEERY